MVGEWGDGFKGSVSILFSELVLPVLTISIRPDIDDS